MKDKKKIGLVAGIAAAVAVIGVISVVLIGHFNKKEETYRSIQVYDLEGSATIDREGVGNIQASEKLFLQSGDKVQVAADSFMRLKLDDDKYISVEQNSSFWIEANGDDAHSKTKIHLEQGAVTSEIQNKLNDGSTYEVTTPNSVMAVRGTTFRVELAAENQKQAAIKLSTFSGTVASALIQQDGSLAEEVLVEAGKELKIAVSDKGAQYTATPSDIRYDELPAQALKALGQTVKADHEADAENTENPVNTGNTVNTGAPENEGNMENAANAENTGNPKNDGNPENAGAPEDTGASEDTENLQPARQEEQMQNPAEVPDGGLVIEETDKEQEMPSEEEQKPAVYTVTFMYNGRVFATQPVLAGQCANRPKLVPNLQGDWDFDFSNEIDRDIIIEWK